MQIFKVLKSRIWYISFQVDNAIFLLIKKQTWVPWCGIYDSLRNWDSRLFVEY